MRLLMILGIAAAALMAGAGVTFASDESAWCAYYGGRNSSTNCGFYSLAQCRAAISGVGGTCGMNPRYQSAPDKPRRVRHQRRQHPG